MNEEEPSCAIGRTAVEFNRNHYFMLGLVVLALGLQFRYVDSYVLNEQATKVAAKVIKPTTDSSTFPPILNIPSVQPRQVLKPPKWLGWAAISIGGVLVLHSLAMQKPGG